MFLSFDDVNLCQDASLQKSFLPPYLVFIPAMEDGFCPGESVPFAANGQRDDLTFRPPEGKDAQSQSQERSAAVHFWVII